MAVTMFRQFAALLPALRLQPTAKRVRVLLSGEVIVDTTAALPVWEPRRVVPSYAVPGRDMTAALVPLDDAAVTAERPVPLGEGPPVLDPSTGFGAHTTPGEGLTVVTRAARVDGAAFRPADPDLAGYVILDFAAFDWLEEDEPIISHPRDPFSRIDVRRSRRHVRLELDGVVLADSTRPQLLFESGFPMPRYYLPRGDVLVELTAGTMQTTCAYKGHATHHSAVVGGRIVPDIAWSYEDPLSDAGQVKGLVSFLPRTTGPVRRR